MQGPNAGDSNMAGNGTYLEGKVGETKVRTKTDEEIREGMARELEKLRNMKNIKEETLKDIGIGLEEGSVLGLERIGKLPIDFLDIVSVIENGALKYGSGSYLDTNNESMEHTANHASMSRHLAEAYCGIMHDKQSGLHPLLHLACRALMRYSRIKRGIIDG